MKILVALLMPLAGFAGIWPENVGKWKRTSVEPVTVADRPLWDEYGLKEAQKANYEDGSRNVMVTGWRLQDSTAALAAFEWQRPAGARPGGSALSARTADSVLVAHGNCLMLFQGSTPGKEDLTAFISAVPGVELAALPTLPDFFPTTNLVPNSERYVIGPAGLEQFDPGIPPSVAAFHLGAEAQVGTFRMAAGDVKLALFNYPTPQLAMQQAGAFQKLAGAVVKRSGPLVAVLLSPPSADAAERLLAEVRYQAAVTQNERVPTRKDNIGNLILTIFELTGILLVFAIVSGVAFGGMRTLSRKRAGGDAADAMILLHLDRGQK